MNVQDNGAVDGYGAYFGNVDSHGDVIDRGAFASSLADWKRKGGTPAMLLQHADGPLLDDALPIGVWTHMHEDENGLWCEGKLALGNRRADDVYALLRMSPPAVSGLSIGYVARRFTMMPKASEVRRKLHVVDLREISIVHHPSNDLARIQRVKSRYGDDAAARFSRALQRLATELRA